MLACLRCKHTLRLITVTLALAVFLVGILHCNLLVHEVLAVHIGDCGVRGFEIGVAHKTISLAEILFVACNIGRRNETAKALKGLQKNALVNHGVKVADE